MEIRKVQLASQATMVTSFGGESTEEGLLEREPEYRGECWLERALPGWLKKAEEQKKMPPAANRISAEIS